MRPKKPERCASSAARRAATSGPPAEVGAEAPAVSFRRTKYRLSVGVQVSARSNEVKRETVMVTARARKKLPVTPVVEMRGRKTTIGVIVEPIRGTVNSRSALWMACERFWPASRCNTMFSSTTIASSITKPTAAARPPRVMRLKLWPVIFSTMKVMSKVAGMTNPATSELPQSRKKSTRMIEKRLEMNSWRKRSAKLLDLRVNFVRHVERVALRLPIHIEQHGGFPVSRYDRVDRRGGGRDGRNVAKPNRHT